MDISLTNLGRMKTKGVRAANGPVAIGGEAAPAGPAPAWNPDKRIPNLVAALSSGEVNFLWWFIQGSIMDVDVRWSLRHGWGFCDRHTWAWLCVEAAFRHDYLNGPAVLYEDLMARARGAFDITGLLVERRLAHRLRARGPCHLCAQGLGPDSQGFIAGNRLQLGRDTSHLRAFMKETRPLWRETVCGPCAGSSSPIRCRVHLCAEIERDVLDNLDANRLLVRWIARHIGHYNQSFRWEMRGTDTVKDRAALISAAGWCGGWRGLLAVLGDTPQ